MLIEDLDHLLKDLLPCSILDRHPNQTTELSHTMIDMYHEVANLKLLDLLQREGHLTTAGLVALEVILMETVENLVVGEEADAQIVVGKTLMEGILDRSESYL